MHCFAFLAFLAVAHFGCLSATSSKKQCFAKLDTHVCVMPLNYSGNSSSAKSASAHACLVTISLTTQLQKSLAQCGGSLKLDSLTIVHRRKRKFYRQGAVYWHKNETYNESTMVHYLKFQVTAESLLQMFSTRPPAVFKFPLFPFYEKCVLPMCAADRETVVHVQYDRAPTVWFELFNVTQFDVNSTASANVDVGKTLVINGTSNGSQALGIGVDSNVVFDVHADDEDVFENNSDALEYSAISKLNVTLSAVVHFYDTWQNDVALFLDTTAWCESELANLTVRRSHVRVQYRLLMANLSAAVTKLHRQSMKLMNLSDTAPFARVLVTIEASAASGSGRKAMASAARTFALAVLVPLPQILSESAIIKTPQTNITSKIAVKVDCSDGVRVPLWMKSLLVVSAALLHDGDKEFAKLCKQLK